MGPWEQNILIYSSLPGLDWVWVCAGLPLFCWWRLWYWFWGRNGLLLPLLWLRELGKLRFWFWNGLVLNLGISLKITFLEMGEESTLVFTCSSRFEPNNQGDNVVSDLFGWSSAKDLISLVKHPRNRFRWWVFKDWKAEPIAQRDCWTKLTTCSASKFLSFFKILSHNFIMGKDVVINISWMALT